MARKLGEYLVERGILSPKQVQEALRAQRIFGGTLGTHIVELGLASEDAVADALAEIYGVSAARRAAVLSSGPGLAALLSPEFCRRHRAVPVERSGDELLLAMQNPRDQLALQEAAFLTGLRVLPLVAPERVIRDALKRAHRVGTHAAEEDSEAGVDSGSPPSKHDDSAFRTGPQLAAEMDRPTTLAQQLASATHRDQVLNLALDELGTLFPRRAAFAVKSERAVMLCNKGFDFNRIRTVSVALTPDLVLGTAHSAQELFVGRVTSTAANQDFYTLLGGKLPTLACVVPVLVRQRVVILLYGDRLNDARVPATKPLYRLRGMVGLALEILLLKTKLLGGESPPSKV